MDCTGSKERAINDNDCFIDHGAIEYNFTYIVNT